MSKTLIAFALALTLFACSKKDGSKETELPVTIQEVIDSYTSCTCDPYINLYTWRGQPVYLQSIYGPLCNGVPQYYDKKGKPIAMPDGYTQDQFVAEATFVKVVWECNPTNGNGQ
ncbi:MAG: hypothetical protein ABW019_11710 [Chitinophagaceae bacterium]